MFVSMLFAMKASYNENQTVNLLHASVAAMFPPPTGSGSNVDVWLVTSIAREGGDAEQLELVTRLIGPDGEEAMQPIEQTDDLPPPSLISLINRLDLRLRPGRYEVWLEINGERAASCALGVVD